MKLGENPKTPNPQCGRSIKTYARGNNDTPSISKYGFVVRPHAQILAVRTHYVECAPQDGEVWRVLTTSDVGNVTKGQWVPDHQVLPINLGVTSCPPPTWRYGPRKSML